MGVSTKEYGVLKLVHPGRHVETHTQPVPAYEIMRRYPRHCVTRPDVFKYPYIVVRPESLLLPGKVFYLVPKRTLYKLLKASNPQDNRRGRRLPRGSSCYGNNQDSEGYNSDTSYVDAWNGIRGTSTADQPSFDISVSFAPGNRPISDNIGSSRISADHGELKSCVRKEDSRRKGMNLRVDFDFLHSS